MNEQAVQLPSSITGVGHAQSVASPQVSHGKSEGSRLIKQNRRWAAVLAIGMISFHAVGAQSKAEPQRFTGLAIDMTNGGTGNSSRVEMVVDRWSTEVERAALATTFDEQGTGGLLKMLRERPRIGYVGVAGRLGNDVAFARQVLHSDGSRRVILITPRRLSFNEATRDAPTVDYPFTFIELHLDATDAGEGTISVGAKIKLHQKDDLIEHEDFSAGTVFLKGVKASRK
jgi:hypothetical protein